MDPHLVSIVIPCWNAARLVGDAIESALAQTHQNVEVIVIDDGSTDHSLDVIRSFGDSIRWETGPNRGACAARNRGLALARGEFVQFLDADDVLFSSKTEEMLKLSSTLDPLSVATCDWEYLSADTGEAILVEASFPTDDPVVLCIKGWLQTSSPLHRRSILLEVGGFDESLPCSQERDLHLRLACHGVNFVHTPMTLFRVRQQIRSVSSDITKVLEQRLGVFLGAKRILENSGKLSIERRTALASVLAQDGRRCVRHGMISKAQDYFDAARSVEAGCDLRAFNRLLNAQTSR